MIQSFSLVWILILAGLALILLGGAWLIMSPTSAGQVLTAGPWNLVTGQRTISYPIPVHHKVPRQRITRQPARLPVHPRLMTLWAPGLVPGFQGVERTYDLDDLEPASQQVCKCRQVVQV